MSVEGIFRIEVWGCHEFAAPAADSGLLLLVQAVWVWHSGSATFIQVFAGWTGGVMARHEHALLGMLKGGVPFWEGYHLSGAE